MQNYVDNISVDLGNGTYDTRPIGLDSDHVNIATYDPSTTEADSLTKKIHDLEEATPDVATATTAGIVKPGSGLQMASGQTDGTIELAYDHTLTLTDANGTTLGTFDGSADETVSVSTVPTNHSSSNTTYGIGDTLKYGHVKLIDSYKTAPATPAGTAASATGIYNMYSELANATGINYNNTSSGLAASTVQGAIDENNSNIEIAINEIADINSDLTNKADKSTTLSGYGITNAYTKTEIDTLLDSIDVQSYGTASSTATSYQKIEVDGTAGSNVITGSMYMQQSVTLSTSAETTATFTNSSITTSSAIEVFTTAESLTYKSMSISAGRCTVTFDSVDTATTITVRIYIK